MIGESDGGRASGEDERSVVVVVGGREVDARTPFQGGEEGCRQIRSDPACHAVPTRAVALHFCSHALRIAKMESIRVVVDGYGQRQIQS
ncbi:hypothetical protein TanjilG_08080 [Lupinus angustifolius]|uniref:Uncharacterized protein n=1 Tax=Lupinus angustifolius TaxID=3871 RepID=A0A1J7IRB3_LUPAN|nr:hypothetical protein TanjilG_08080 [Lupinus angustifolius]